MPQVAYQYLYYFALFVLTLLCLLGLYRAIRGPRIADRVISINMISTLVIAIICILAVLKNEGYLVDVALIYSLLGFLAVVVLCKVYMGIALRRKAENEKQISSQQNAASSVSKEIPNDTEDIAQKFEEETSLNPTPMQHTQVKLEAVLKEFNVEDNRSENHSEEEIQAEEETVLPFESIEESTFSQSEEVSVSSLPNAESAAVASEAISGIKENSLTDSLASGSDEPGQENSLSELIAGFAAEHEKASSLFSEGEIEPISVEPVSVSAARLSDTSSRISEAIERFQSISDSSPEEKKNSSEEPEIHPEPVHFKKAKMPSSNYSGISEWEKASDRLDQLLREFEIQSKKDE